MVTHVKAEKLLNRGSTVTYMNVLKAATCLVDLLSESTCATKINIDHKFLRVSF